MARISRSDLESFLVCLEYLAAGCLKRAANESDGYKEQFYRGKAFAYVLAAELLKEDFLNGKKEDA